MNMEELITIIVPAYNIAPWIESCVRTILQQTYSHLEIILVNDGSTDSTGVLMDRLAETDSRIRVIHQSKGGVTQARLAGAAAAAGEWIGFVDGDGVIEPDMYERLLRNAQKYHAKISHCGYQMVFPDRVDYYYNTGRLVEQDKQTGLKDLMEGAFIEPGLWNKLYHKSLLRSLLSSRVMDLTIRNTEDLLMNFYLFRMSDKSVYEDVCPYHYMIREGSAATSKVNEHRLRDPLKVLHIIEAEMMNSPELQRIVKGRIASRLISLATMKDEDRKDLIRPVRSKAREELRGMVPELLRGRYSGRTKILFAWAAIWPWSYGTVHALYAKIRRTDRKYELSSV